ncbi:ankyrin [Parathielavia appendiculata]|uniref:Ankyrin n=1 Tax=Parathielavia appendiculata TaxID=2587402 RepID=A0AAN6U6Q0_9PEZI|nr:ankyrin [Parathielavia appendiculata]
MPYADSRSAVPAATSSSSSPVSPITSLPVELFLDIATRHCPLTAKNLNALARTCRSLYELLNPLLYRFNVETTGASAAMHAARHGHVAVLERLAAHGADFAAVKDEDGWEYGPVGVAARHGQDEILSWFLRQTGVGESPLVLHSALVGAVFGGHVQICRVLRQHGIELQVLAKKEKGLAVADALQRARADVISALAKRLIGEEAEHLIRNGDFPEDAAMVPKEHDSNEEQHGVKQCLTKHADSIKATNKTIHDSNGQETPTNALTATPSPSSMRPAQPATGVGSLPTELMLGIANTLGSSDLNSLARSCRGLSNLITPLLIGTLERLVEAGAEVNSMVSEPTRRFCPIHIAAKYGHVEALAWLLDHGAQMDDLSQGTREGYGGHAGPNITALHAAATCNNVALIDYLVERNLVHPARANRWGGPALYYAAVGAHSGGGPFEGAGSRWITS